MRSSSLTPVVVHARTFVAGLAALAALAAPVAAEAQPNPAAPQCGQAEFVRPGAFNWRDIVVRNEAQLRADTRTLARAFGGLIHDRVAMSVVNRVAGRRQACEIRLGAVYCDYAATLSQLSAELALAGIDLRALLRKGLALSGAGDREAQRIDAIVPVIEIEGLRLDPYVRVPTLDASFYPNTPAAPTVVIAGQLEPGGEYATGFGDPDGDGVIQPYRVDQGNFQKYVLWSVGLNATNLELSHHDDVYDILGPTLKQCYKKAPADGEGCACRSQLPHYCGSRCFIGCWGTP